MSEASSFKAVSVRSDGVSVSGEMTIFSAASLKQSLLDAVRGSRPQSRAEKKRASKRGAQTDAWGMDLTQVTEFDTAGLQLVLMARQEAIGSGREFKVTAASHAVREAFALCGAVGLLADAPVTEVVL